MKLEWIQAPVKTQWGDEMVVASVAIDKDHTLSLYCERNQASKVEAMFAQRTWVGLTEERIKDIWLKGKDHGDDWLDVLSLARSFETELKELNK